MNIINNPYVWRLKQIPPYKNVQYTGKPLYMQLIRATIVPYISKPHIWKLKTNGKNCNSSMMSWNIRPKT
jgi:hypothetical protein